MAKQTVINVGDLVVFNHELDATVFRVKRVEGFALHVVDRSIEHLDAKEQIIDKSLAKPLSVGQLKRLTVDHMPPA